MIEKWITIKGFSDYQISSVGRIRSLKFNKIKPFESGSNLARGRRGADGDGGADG